MSSCVGIPTGRSSFTCTGMRSRRKSCRVRSPKLVSRPAQPGGSPSMCMPARHDRKRCLPISKSIRSKAPVGLLAVASLLQGSPAAAHGFGQRYDLPLPLSLYLFGAAAAVVVSFIIVGLFVRGGASRSGFDRRFDLMPLGIGRLILHPAPGLVLKFLALAIFAVTVAAGFIGNQDPYRNLAPTMVWIIFWVGLAYVSAFVGDIWALINPWRTIFAAAEHISKRVAYRPLRQYPEALGVWPACVLLLVFSWIELVYPSSAEPRHIAWFATAYSLLTWVGMALF